MTAIAKTVGKFSGEKASSASRRFFWRLKKNQQGFSLVELITVLVLLGIISTVVAPRFSSRDGFADYAIRDQLVAAARMAQQRAMYDHSVDACFRLEINSAVLAVQSFDGIVYNNIGPTPEWLSGIAINDVTVADTRVYFDGLGSPLDSTADCGGVPMTTDIAINGPSNLGVCIYETGYIQAQSCPP